MKIPFFTQRQNRSAVSIPTKDSTGLDPSNIILHYHEQTKHHYHRFARSLGFLDWDNQPNPFRRFRESPFIQLPLLAASERPLFGDLFKPNAVSTEPLSFSNLSRFFRNSLAISAWKRAGDARWALRVNPSSGNLHPTEGYLILRDTFPEIQAGVYHYAPQEHGLEQRATFESEIVRAQSTEFPEDTFFVGLSSIHWRESWKYGERAYRYCQHDVGHAIAALRISAAILGWGMVMLDELSDEQIARTLGLNRAQDFEQAEDEDPVCIAAVFPSQNLPSNAFINEEMIQSIERSEWKGKANLLSESHVEWEIIDRAALAALKPATAIVDHDLSTNRAKSQPYDHFGAEQIVQQRRSCLALDGRTTISQSVFYSILSSVIPSMSAMPFDSLQRSELNRPRIHLLLFVHRVDNLEAGLYFLVRSTEVDLKVRMNPNFKWQRPEGCPDGMNLFLLQSGDFRGIATGVACGQDIGGDGVFSVGMIAEMESPVRNLGAWMYRRLFWEAGVIGQVLYLEAEAAGIRSTGIGCYFDDPTHELLGLKGYDYQDLYHFTLGGNVEDTRLTTEPAYEKG
jgi:SagB-type dehydrogenase family enzyme